MYVKTDACVYTHTHTHTKEGWKVWNKELGSQTCQAPDTKRHRHLLCFSPQHRRHLCSTTRHLLGKRREP